MTTLIKGGLVYDGSGMAPFAADVLVHGGHIARVGEVGKVRSHAVVDAAGAIVTPGFIDVGGEADHHLTLFSEPAQAHLVRQGITTTLVGNGGVSLAPLLDGSLATFEAWGPARGVNLRAETVKELLSFVKKRGIGVNVGTFVGYTTLRRAFTRGAVRDLTERELAAVEKVITRAYRDGAFGVSVGFSDPSVRRVPFVELKALAEHAARARRALVLPLYREGATVERSLKEALSLAHETGVNLEINNLEPLAGHREHYTRILALLDEATVAAHVHFDLYPTVQVPLLLATLLPEWLQKISRAEALHYLRTREGIREVAAYLEQFRDIPFSVGYVGSQHLASLEGKVLGELASHSHRAFGESLLSFMTATELHVILTAPLADPLLLTRYLSHERALVTAGGFPRGPKPLLAFLRLARTGALPFERMVEKLTSIPAKKFGIAGRGAVKTGYCADLVVLRDGVPSDVLVNGRFVLKNGNKESALPGAVLHPSRV